MYFNTKTDVAQNTIDDFIYKNLKVDSWMT